MCGARREALAPTLRFLLIKILGPDAHVDHIGAIGEKVILL